jgi:protein-L-isoaspartate(D-aspartate) O-methyltransferase
MRAADACAEEFAAARRELARTLRAHVRDVRVIDAMLGVPRELFVPDHLRARAYDDRALPIGEGQTISQPLMIALMVEALELRAGDRVLEVGAGSGYAAAVLARLAREVVTVERLPTLLTLAKSRLASLGAASVRTVEAGDELGVPALAPFDAILVSAGAPHVPRTLLEQLGEGGRLVVPVGTQRSQELVRATKSPVGLQLTRLGGCAFVPLVGKGAWEIGDRDDVSRRLNLQ